MGRRKEKQVFLGKRCFCDSPSHESMGPQKPAQLLLPTVPLPTGYSRRSCGTHSHHTLCAESISTYSQKREQASGLRAWLPSITTALCRGALQQSAGGIPDCSLSKEKLRTSVFGGPQPTPTSAKTTVFSEMPNMLVTTTFVLYSHSQRSQWAVAKRFSRAFCFRLMGWSE